MVLGYFSYEPAATMVLWTYLSAGHTAITAEHFDIFNKIDFSYFIRT